MARQLDVARWSLRRTVLRHHGWPSSVHHRCFFSSVSSSNASNSGVSTRPTSSIVGHHSLISSTPHSLALQHVRGLLQQPQRRVLLLTGSSALNSATRAALERDAPAFELERRGHGIYGMREFCQLLLRERGRDRRVFGRAQLAALLLHSGLELPGASRLAATSTLQRRKGVQDLLQLFRLLESEGVTPEQYAATAVASGDQVPQELAEIYRKYQELLMQHDATSWDGLVLDVLTRCGLQSGGAGPEEAVAKQFSQSLLEEYTDVLLDDVQRMTPAMARLAGHLCGQPSVQSSASFSRVLRQGDECFRTQILEQQLLKTAADTGRTVSTKRVALPSTEMEDDTRARTQAFAQQVLAQSDDTEAVDSPVPFKCWRFGASEAEEQGVGAYLADTLNSDGPTRATVVCPSYADAHRLTMAFKKQGLPVQLDGDRYSAAMNSTGATIHLFDEPGVNAVYSLLCALCYPSDSRHLYNVLRSDFFAFPAELLSWLMEKENRSHADLFSVLEAFIDSRGQSLSTSLNQREGEHQELPQTVSTQLESGLQIAESFVKTIKRLRAECHERSAPEIVQTFLEETGRLETLRSPTSPEHERESLVMADFLRELETAQNVVGSAQVVFVAPYLQQLRETNLTSSAAWEESSPEVVTEASRTAAGEACIRVLPLTAYALESVAASVSDEQGDSKHVLVLMSMRDSKFPGRMKRLTLPLPYDLLSEPFPVQTRTEHLDQCARLAYEAMTLDAYDEVVLSFAELAAISSSKREILSRTLQPIWHEGDRPVPARRGEGGGKGRTAPPKTVAPASKLSAANHVGSNTAATPKHSPFWLSEVVEFWREFVSRVFLPMFRHEKRLANANDDQEQQEATELEQPRAAMPNIRREAAPASRLPYKPAHLSYSQISEYLRCPHRYYLGRVMKLDGDASTAMMFGRALHEGVAAFARSLATAQANGEVTEEARNLAAVEAEETFMRAWAGDGYGLFASEEQASFLRERGLMALWDFIETHHGDLQLEEILHVEQEFSFHVPEANVELRGVWDRIDRVSTLTGEGVVIKEFKSNMGGAARNMRKLADESLQLKMYMYAFRKVFGEAPYGAKLQQIGGKYNEPSDEPTKTGRKRTSRAVHIDNGFVHFTESAAQEAEAAIVEVASGLRRGQFEPKPSFAECAFCPYAGSACHFATDDALHEHHAARRASKASA